MSRLGQRTGILVKKDIFLEVNFSTQRLTTSETSTYAKSKENNYKLSFANKGLNRNSVLFSMGFPHTWIA